MISGATNAKINACHTNVDLINSQIELYYANKGAWPADLKTVTGNVEYFPDGAPACPFGTAYVYNTTIHRVSAHTHGTAAVAPAPAAPPVASPIM